LGPGRARGRKGEKVRKIWPDGSLNTQVLPDQKLGGKRPIPALKGLSYTPDGSAEAKGRTIGGPHRETLEEGK